MAVVVAFEVLAEARDPHIGTTSPQSAKPSSRPGQPAQVDRGPVVLAQEPPTEEAPAMAAPTRLFIFLFPAAVLADLASASASPFLSDNLFQASTGSTGRSLLQAKNDCPIGFETQNYTILTKKCKGPQYPPAKCCDAFKEFACPFAAYINNESTNCADTMFSYIDFHGYPKGLFADECQKGKEGVSCEGIPAVDTGVPSGGPQVQGVSRPLVVLLCGLGTMLLS